MKWQNPIKEGHQKNVEALTRINKLLEVTKLTPEQRTEAMLLIDKAAKSSNRSRTTVLGVCMPSTTRNSVLRRHKPT